MKFTPAAVDQYGNVSPPSRAAWIEISQFSELIGWLLSPPSRAAWIEMQIMAQAVYAVRVAAFTGGVD